MDSSPPSHSRPRLYRPAFFALAAAYFCFACSFGSFYLLPVFVENHGGSELDIGLVMGIFTLAGVLARPWTSEMVDRIGRKRSFTLGCLVMTALPLIYVTFQGRYVDFDLPLLAVRAVHGVGFAVCFTSAFTYVADIVPPQRLNEGFGIFGVSGLSGLAAGPAVAEFIVDLYGFKTMFLSACGMAGLALLLQIPVPETLARQAHGSEVRFFALLRSPKIRLVVALGLLFGIAIAASGGFITPYAKYRGLAFASLFYIAYSGTAATIRLFGGRLADRLGEARIIPYALALSAAGFLLLPLVHGSLLLAFCGFLAGAGHGFLFPCLTALALRDEAPNVRGKIAGIMTGGIDFGVFSGSIVLGLVGELTGFLGIFLTAGGALSVALAVFWYRGNRVVAGSTATV